MTEETPLQAGGVCHERRNVHEHAQERNVVLDMPHSVTTLQIVDAASSGVSNPQFVNDLHFSNQEMLEKNVSKSVDTMK